VPILPPVSMPPAAEFPPTAASPPVAAPPAELPPVPYDVAPASEPPEWLPPYEPAFPPTPDSPAVKEEPPPQATTLKRIKPNERCRIGFVIVTYLEASIHGIFLLRTSRTSRATHYPLKMARNRC
jgi:hypothetical protein